LVFEICERTDTQQTKTLVTSGRGAKYSKVIM